MPYFAPKNSPKIQAKKNIALVLAMFFFLALDRLLKKIVWHWPQKTIALNKWLSFHLATNKFIAFSLPLPLNRPSLIILIFLLLVLLIIWLISSWRQKNFFTAFCLIFILGGAFSNWWDRLIYGQVVDYIDLSFFTIFNLADVMVVIGVLAILALNIKKQN